MKETLNNLENLIAELKRKVKQFKPQEAQAIREEIKNLYMNVANSLKVLNQTKEELRIIAHNFSCRKSSQTEAGKFYSFIKSQTSADLDLATLVDRAWNLIVMEDYDEAIKVLKRVLSIDRKNVKGLGLMSLALMNKELYDNAMLYLQQVLLIDSDNPFALNNLGYICYKKGVWGEAIEHLTKVVKQTRDRTAALYANYYLGLLYYDRSMILDAIKFFKEALKLGPNLQEAYYYLGLSEMKKYKFTKAVGYFEKCIKIDCNSRYGRLGKEKLDEIQPIKETSKTNPTNDFKK